MGPSSKTSVCFPTVFNNPIMFQYPKSIVRLEETLPVTIIKSKIKLYIPTYDGTGYNFLLHGKK